MAGGNGQADGGLPGTRWSVQDHHSCACHHVANLRQAQMAAGAFGAKIDDTSGLCQELVSRSLLVTVDRIGRHRCVGHRLTRQIH